VQIGVEEGEIDFAPIVRDLQSADDSGVSALEVVQVGWLLLDGQNVRSETVWLRDWLLDLI